MQRSLRIFSFFVFMPRGLSRAASDDVFNEWSDDTRRRDVPSPSASPAGRRHRKVSVVMHRAQSSRRSGDFNDMAAMALHGKQKFYFDEHTFVQHLSSATVQMAPPATFDAVSFNFTDRIAAWFSGYGKELRMLKEAQMEEPLQPDGTAVTVSTMTRFRRRSLVLLGGEENELNRTDPAALAKRERNADGPALLRAMSDLMLRVHYVAFQSGAPCAHDPDVSAADVLGVVEDLKSEYPLTFWERMYLRVCDGFTENEKDMLLERGEYAKARPAAEFSRSAAGTLIDPTAQHGHAPSDTAASPQPPRAQTHATRSGGLSISDCAPTAWPPKRAATPSRVARTANTRAVSRARRARRQSSPVRDDGTGQNRPLSPSRDGSAVMHSEHL